MESKSKIFGHPAHNILIVFPLGLLSTSVIFDTLGRFSSKSRLAATATDTLAAGVIGGLAAAPFGWNDWRSIPDGTRAKEIGRWHGIGNGVVLALFSASWLLRRGAPEKPGTVPLTLSLLGGLLAMGTGWLGGELVGRLGIGVDEGANINAPNSLSGLPASPSE